MAHSAGSFLARLSGQEQPDKFLARPSYAELGEKTADEYVQRWLSHWKQYTGLVKAVNAPSSGYRDPKSKRNKLAEYQARVDEAAKHLSAAGFYVDKVGNRYQLLPIT